MTPTTRQAVTHRWLPALVLLSLLIASTGCSSLLGSEESEGQAETGESVLELEPFSCVDLDLSNPDPDDSHESSVTVVPCEQPHLSQMYMRVVLLENLTETDPSYPDQAFLDEHIERCGSHFERMVGVPADESELDWQAIYPDEQTWEQEEVYWLHCFVYDPAGPTTVVLDGVPVRDQ